VDQQTGAWAIRSMSEWMFRLRSQGTWSRLYDTVIAGDIDGDGFLNDLFVWDHGTGPG
jgi:hypothetical protein